MKESNNNFQDVKRLLKLKQHEVPPPGYFNSFSSQVISRIRAEEARESRSAARDGSWWSKFLGIFESQPRVVGGVATAVCLLLVLGLVATQQPDADSNPAGFLSASAQPDQTSGQSFAANSPMAAPAGALGDPLASSGIAVSTNPVTSLQPMASAFGQPGTVSLFQPAGFDAQMH